MSEKKANKDKFIKLRVSEAERDRWNKKARSAGLTLADYFRRLADEEPTNITPVGSKTPRKFTPVDPELIRHVSWVGNNLNQIARQINQAGVTNAEQLHLDLLAIYRSLEKMKNAL